MGDAFGGKQASPPTLDTNQSKALTQADYDLKQKNTPELVETTGQAGREEYARNIAFGLQAFANPSSIFQFDLEDAGKNISETNKQIASIGGWRGDKYGRRYNPTSKKWVSSDEYQKQLSGLNKKLETQKAERTQLGKMAKDPVGTLERTFKDEFKLRDQFQGQLDRAQESSTEYNRMQRALQKGLSAQTVGQRRAATSQAAAAQANTMQGRAAQMGRVADVRAQQIDASTMGNFGAARSSNISAGQVGAGALGETLMSRAKQMAKSTGRLDAQAERDAVQSARQGFAARGMATGSGAMAAELLNRDRYSRQRQFEDLNFAQGVQGQDITRQFQNVGNRLTADQSNQSAAMQAELANLQARYNAAVQDGNWEQAAAIQNQSANMQASLANQQTAFNTGQFNAGNQQQMNMANMAAINQGNQFNAANRQQTNLANMQATNNMRQFNTQLASGVDQFNALQRTDNQRFNLGALQSSALAADNEQTRQLGLGQSAYNFALQTNPKLMLAGLGSPYANFTPQALGLMNNTNVAPIYSGGQLGSPGAFQTIMGTAGQFAQAGGQAYAASASDRRMKKDIKQTGKDGLLGLKTYEYRFKGESKDSPKHRGFMAQEVQKVLPEAVEEFDYKGKKRLAIKPGVIGQAMAQMLAEQQKNMFADGYVVGAGAGA